MLVCRTCISGEWLRRGSMNFDDSKSFNGHQLYTFCIIICCWLVGLFDLLFQTTICTVVVRYIYYIVSVILFCFGLATSHIDALYIVYEQKGSLFHGFYVLWLFFSFFLFFVFFLYLSTFLSSALSHFLSLFSRLSIFKQH